MHDCDVVPPSAIQSGRRAASEVMRAEGSALVTAAGALAAQAARIVPG
ncbi:MAG: hypothetical protein ACJ75Z_02885 [Solirubrobacterales bacterium]